MSYLRFRMDLAVPEPIPKELKEDLDDIKEHMLRLQEFSVKINGGKVNEEDSDRLEEYVCHHDIHKACEKPHEIRLSKRRKKEKKQYDTMGKLQAVGRIPFTKWCLARRKPP